MRIAAFVCAAAFVGGAYYLQEHPEIKQQVKQTFSRENLLEVKFKDKKKQKEYQENKTSMFYPRSPS